MQDSKESPAKSSAKLKVPGQWFSKDKIDDKERAKFVRAAMGRMRKDATRVGSQKRSQDQHQMTENTNSPVHSITGYPNVTLGDLMYCKSPKSGQRRPIFTFEKRKPKNVYIPRIAGDYVSMHFQVSLTDEALDPTVGMPSVTVKRLPDYCPRGPATKQETDEKTVPTEAHEKSPRSWKNVILPHSPIKNSRPSALPHLPQSPTKENPDIPTGEDVKRCVSRLQEDLEVIPPSPPYRTGTDDGMILSTHSGDIVPFQPRKSRARPYKRRTSQQ